MVYVTDQLVAESGRPGESWCDRALENLRRRTPAGAFEAIHPESGLLLCTVGDAYDASRALTLDSLVPGHDRDGWFVGLPARDQLLALPVSANALGTVHLLKLLANKHYQNMPYPISNDVFWLHQGRWRRFPIHFEGTKVAIQPPDEFSEVLEHLDLPIDSDDGLGG
jgi:hypothetical protein